MRASNHKFTEDELVALSKSKGIVKCKKCFGRGFTGWVEGRSPSGERRRQAILCGCMHREMRGVVQGVSES